MLNYILKRFTKIVVRIILLLFVLVLMLLSILYVSYKSRTNNPYPNEVFDFVDKNKSEILLNKKNKKYLEGRKIWAIRINKNGEVIESFNKPNEVKDKFEITDIARFTRYYLNDYPVFTYIIGDGLIVFGYPKNSFDKFPINFVDYKSFAFNLKLSAFFLLIFLFLVYLMYKIDVKNIFKKLDPVQKSIEQLYEEDFDKLEEVGELSELSKSINDANMKYQDLKSTQAKWIRGISHDIRTPLAKISWSLNEIKEEKNLEEITKIQEQILKISNIIEDLNLTMSISSLSKDKFTMADPVPILRKLIVEKLNEYPDREIIFDNELDKVKINMNNNLFYRMVENVLKNSLSYTDGIIKVSAYSLNDKMFISMEDEGQGIEEKLIEKVQNSDLSHVTTHGMGLFISKQIAEILGGSIFIENTYPGVKVLFSFNLI
ncbi:sensor histidine kinase [Peptoniphilus sp. SGI.035]|uniref:sensor histidine kinase n=1 Tax=Peptoniphilus sp. SGI.035 TaxID=3420564 RepID=UPI003D064033